MSDDFDLSLDELSIDLSDVKLLDEAEYGFEIVGLKKEQTKPSEKNPDGFPTLRITFNIFMSEDGKSVGRRHFQGFPMVGQQAFSTMALLTCLGLAEPGDEHLVLKGADLMGRRFMGYVQHRTDKQDRTFAEIRRFIEPLY